MFCVIFDLVAGLAAWFATTFCVLCFVFCVLRPAFCVLCFVSPVHPALSPRVARCPVRQACDEEQRLLTLTMNYACIFLSLSLSLNLSIVIRVPEVWFTPPCPLAWRAARQGNTKSSVYRRSRSSLLASFSLSLSLSLSPSTSPSLRATHPPFCSIVSFDTASSICFLSSLVGPSPTQAPRPAPPSPLIK